MMLEFPNMASMFFAGTSCVIFIHALIDGQRGFAFLCFVVAIANFVAALT
jgi:hypothetical protein